MHGETSNLVVRYELETFPVVKSYILMYRYSLRLQYINEQYDGPSD